MPCKRLQPSYRPSANSLTLVPTGTTEYIAAGDSQAAVPFPTDIRRDFDLQWKTASGLSYLLLQPVVMAGKRAFQRRALRRPHPARREVTCGDTDMDWPRLGAVLHTTGLWGRSYLGVGRRAASRTWQKLCQREDTGLPWGKPYHGRIHIWDYPKGNQAIRTPSPVQGLTGDPASLTAGGAWRILPGFTIRGTELGEKKAFVSQGEGGMAQQAWHRPVLPTHYLLPNTREETGSTRRL